MCLLSGPSIPDVLVFLQWIWCQDLYWASVPSQCCDLHPRLPNLQGRSCCVDLELSSRRVSLRVLLVSTHLPVWKDSAAPIREGIVPPADLVLPWVVSLPELGMQNFSWPLLAWRLLCIPCEPVPMCTKSACVQLSVFPSLSPFPVVPNSRGKLAFVVFIFTTCPLSLAVLCNSSPNSK